MKGKLYLIPCLLGGDDVSILPEFNKKMMNGLEVFVVENLRSARRFLRVAGYTKNFDTEVTMYELDKHQTKPDYKAMLQATNEGKSIGLISEAGNPCIADPGHELVAKAHTLGIDVVPLVGPNSILLTLIGSGFNGQHFCFHGYLPIESNDRIKKLRAMEADVQRTGSAHLFMETPYRNQKLLEEILNHLSPGTNVCIGCDLTLPTEFIQTKSVAAWKKQLPDLHKRYAMFAIG